MRVTLRERARWIVTPNSLDEQCRDLADRVAVLVVEDRRNWIPH
jgi:hypothetical protein